VTRRPQLDWAHDKESRNREIEWMAVLTLWSQPGVCSLLLERENRAFFRMFGCHLMKLFLLSDVVEMLELLALSVLSRSVTFMVLTEWAWRRVLPLAPSLRAVFPKLCVILRRKRSFFFGLCSGRGEPVSPETETIVVSASGTLQLL